MRQRGREKERKKIENREVDKRKERKKEIRER